MALKTHTLGRTNIRISSIGLGCVTFGREISEDKSFEIMDYAVECGINFFDTAESYGGAQSRAARRKRYGIDDQREVSNEASSSERILGRWLRSRNCRSEIVISTKFSGATPTPEHIQVALESSLDRLQTERIDVYMSHTWSDLVPIDVTISGLSQHVQSGLVGAIGASNYAASQIAASIQASERNGYTRIEVVQPRYNLARPEPAPGRPTREETEAAILPLCSDREVSVTPYSPLGAGFLTGKYADNHKVASGTRFHIAPSHAEIYFTETNFRILACLRSLASEMRIPMECLALAFVTSHPLVTSAIIGARERSHIDNALAAAELELDPLTRQRMVAWR